MLDPRRLLTFREVATQGSFSRAAEALALSQPAVSQQVSALERELGAELLVRGRAGALPTPAGELLLQHAEALAARLELADEQMERLVEGERRTLRLGAFPSGLATIVPEAIAAVRAQRPELEVDVEEATLAELPRGVQAGRLHLAVCFQGAAAPRREPEGLRRIDLAEEPMDAMLPADHRLAGETEIELRDLADEPWSAPSRDGLVVNATRWPTERSRRPDWPCRSRRDSWLALDSRESPPRPCAAASRAAASTRSSRRRASTQWPRPSWRSWRPPRTPADSVRHAN